MAYLISILLSLALVIGFYLLTCYEVRSGVRFLATYRVRLDKKVKSIEFIFEHVDFNAFFREETRRILVRGGHAIAHHSLKGVRAVEHLLTRLVRHLRTRHAVDTTPGENTREFVKTLADFKDRLKQSQPEVVEVL